MRCSIPAVLCAALCAGHGALAPTARAGSGGDPVFPDGFEPFVCGSLAGLSCDGPDTDLCREGAIGCNAEIPSCGDLTGNLVDLCNGLDDDCDPASPEGSAVPLLGAACDGPDGDLCLEGVFSCGPGMLLCSDATDTTIELCNGLDDDCDLAIDEDLVRDTNPVCATTSTFLGAIAGDTGAGQTVSSGTSERWYRVTLTENLSGINAVSVRARVSLAPGPGTDYDLYVYCVSCGGTLIGSSTNGGTNVDTVDVANDDDIGVDDTFDIVIEVRHFQSARCANWGLTVSGNIGSTANACDP